MTSALSRAMRASPSALFIGPFLGASVIWISDGLPSSAAQETVSPDHAIERPVVLGA
jgi:hypothetical protein